MHANCLWPKFAKITFRENFLFYSIFFFFYFLQLSKRFETVGDQKINCASPKSAGKDDSSGHSCIPSCFSCLSRTRLKTAASASLQVLLLLQGFKASPFTLHPFIHWGSCSQSLSAAGLWSQASNTLHVAFMQKLQAWLKISIQKDLKIVTIANPFVHLGFFVDILTGFLMTITEKRHSLLAKN